ncbi:hypothetical protein CUM88_03065 [Enterococcus faecium]|nr:phosphoribosyltransferase [Enterococcus faecium]EGP5070112.1 phosphoribosyltransferase [Enterococcus faecium]EME8079928.1 phosphoribosyltransferase [Enterococcus faecium]PQC06745.1 hypothetical protein CUM88_03065 [Enterococcus faecium]PQD52829.1 hypothetical protein CUM79_08065 [Enterococcus faecium]RBS48330.1 hypothetical protein EB25_01113 [Enterococcus faecium]
MDKEIFDDFPSKENLVRILQKTIEKSWKNDMVERDIEEWLDNFKGEVFEKDTEQLLALWLLCNFTFYNQDDVRHLCKILYNSFFHQVIIDFSLSNEEEINEYMNNVSYAAIGRASESGNYLLYDFRQEADLNINKFFYPTNIKSDESTIVAFVDDVILSGTTATKFVKNNLKDLKCKKIYYLTLFATESAVEKLKKSNVEVVYCSILGERNQCFSEKSIIFSKYKKLFDPAKKVAMHYGKKLVPKDPLGYKNGQYSFGFYYNTPNNSLPIFWSSINSWIPIFERRVKRRNDRKRKFKNFI